MCDDNFFCRVCDDDVAADELAQGIKPRLRFSQKPQYPRTQTKPEPARPVCEGCGGKVYIPEWHKNCEAVSKHEEPVGCENCGRTIRISDWPATKWYDRILAVSDFKEAVEAKRCRYCPEGDAR